MIDEPFQLMAAPLQGLTEAEWRHAHAHAWSCEEATTEYFTPFIRIEHGEVRARDLRDFTSELNEGLTLTPQIIFRDTDEWQRLVDALVGLGARRIDMNLGCPFVPQVRKGRGAGLLSRRDMLERIAQMVGETREVEFSVKMRLGVDSPSEAFDIADIIAAMPLRHVTIHARTARQQYRGQVMAADACQLAQRIGHKAIYNGDVATPADISRLRAEGWGGVMAGRGLLGRPSLFVEWTQGSERDTEQRNSDFLTLMENVGLLYADRLTGGPAQLRDKLKPFWEYAPSTLDPRIVRLGRKGRL